MATIKQRIQSFITPKSLGNSLGAVIRNYGKEAEFNPSRQVTGITYKAIDKIGQTLSTYDMKVLKKNGDAYENHPLLALYRQPNIRTNSSDFIHLYGMLFEIYGETFWYLAKGESTNRVKEVFLLNPSQMELKISEGELIGYVLHKSDGSRVPFLPEEIIHDKRPNPFNEWRGLSVLEKAAVYVDTEINTSQFTLNYIKNNASPSGIVSLPNMTKEAFKQFAQQWREGYEGPLNAGKTAFIRGEEAKFQAVGATLKDIDQEVTRKMAKDDVLMMLDMPKPLLGMLDDSGFNRASVETLKLIYAESKLEPMMSRLDRVYEKIAASFAREEAINVSHVSPIPEDKEFQLKTARTGVNVWLTVNEIRAQQGLDPLPEGDKLMLDNRPAQNETKAIKIVKKKQLSKAEQARKINEEQENFRSKLVETNDIYSKRIKSAISELVSNQETKTIAAINATSKSYEEWLFSVKEESEVMTVALLPLMLELVEAQSEEVSHFITGELLTISPEMRATIESDILKISGVFNADTIAKLEKTLAQGQAAGESLAKLKKRVEAVYSDAKGYRAERIARTESLRTSNNAAELVYKQNGYTQVEWFINPRACEFCRTYAGRRKTIGSKFNNIGDVITGEEGGQLSIDYAELQTPPLHPNCTCTLIPV